MKLSKISVLVAAAAVSLLTQTANAFYGAGGCPQNYDKANNPFGSSGQVANGLYYLHLIDDQYWTFYETLLPSNMKPTGGRRYNDCGRQVVTKRESGTYITRSARWNGTTYDQIPFNFTCVGSRCNDPTFPQSAFEVVFYRQSDNLMVTHNCFEMTEIIQSILQSFMPQLVEILKSFLTEQLPDFIIQIIVDSVFNSVLSAFKVAHLQWFEVSSTARPLTAEQVNDVRNFANTFPVTNIGSSGTFMDILYPFLLIFRGLNYEFEQLQTVLQDPSFCA